MFPSAKPEKGVMTGGSPGSSSATAVRLIKVHVRALIHIKLWVTGLSITALCLSRLYLGGHGGFSPALCP